MSVSNVHVLYAVNVAGAAGAFMDQVSDWDLSPNIRNLVLGGDGSVDPTYTAVGSQAPSITFSTSKLATVLGKCGINGLEIKSAQELSAFLRKTVEGGTRAGASSHIKLLVNKGLLFPRRLRATNDASNPATLDLECLATYDGSNDPVVITSSQSLTGTPSVSEAFVAGPVSITGTTLNGVQSIDIDFALQTQLLYGDGQVWPSYVYIALRLPIIRVVTLDPVSLATLGISGAAQSGSDSLIYLRKIAEGGTRVADATAEHISFSIDEGHIGVSSIRGSQGRELATEQTITPTSDGTNAIVAINAATAIS